MNENERLRANVTRLAAVLLAHGIAEITATYEGCGDDGQINDVQVRWANQAKIKPEPTVVLVHVRRTWAAGDRTESFEEETHDITEAIELLTDDAINLAGHAGYENNSGGGGSLTVRADASMLLDHYDYYTESVNDVLEFDPPDADPVAAGSDTPLAPAGEIEVRAEAEALA